MTARIAEEGLNDPDEAAGAASDYLKLFGYVALAYMWARMAKHAMNVQDPADPEFYDAKLRTARFYMQRLLPLSSAHFQAAMTSAADTLMAFREADF